VAGGTHSPYTLLNSAVPCSILMLLGWGSAPEPCNHHSYVPCLPPTNPAASLEQACTDKSPCSTPPSPGTARTLQRCLSVAKRVFKSIAVGDARLRARYKQQLLEACEGRRQLLAGRVLAAADAAAEALLAEGARQIGTVSSGAAAGMVGMCGSRDTAPVHVDSLSVQCGGSAGEGQTHTAAGLLLAPSPLPHTPHPTPGHRHPEVNPVPPPHPQAARVKGSWQEVQEELEAFVAHYTAAATGPSKWPKLVTWLMQQGAGLTQAALARAQVGPWVGTRGPWLQGHTVSSHRLLLITMWCLSTVTPLVTPSCWQSWRPLAPWWVVPCAPLFEHMPCVDVAGVGVAGYHMCVP
jgi:hypothetical protein